MERRMRDGGGFTAFAIAHVKGRRLDAEVIAVPVCHEQRDTGGPHAQAGTVRLLGNDPVMAQSPAVSESTALLAVTGTDPTMDGVQVKKLA